jgi:hypothetical protein
MGILVGGTIDLDLLFQFPQRYMDLSGESRGIKGLKLNNGGGSKRCEIHAFLRWKKVIYMGPQNMPIGEKSVKLDELTRWTSVHV